MLCGDENMKIVRVLHVFGVLDKGGAESRTLDIYRAIDRKKIQFDFMVHSLKNGYFEEEIRQLGGCVYRAVPKYRLYNYFQYQSAWYAFLQDNSYSVIHIHTTNSAVPILWAARKAGIPVRICHARSASSSSWIRRLLVACNRPYLRRYSTHRIAVSDDAGKFVFGREYRVVNNAIPISQYRMDSVVRTQMRSQLGLEPDIFCVGHVGRFHLAKNHIFILDIVECVVKQHPSIQFVFAGNGELCDQILGFAKQKGIAQYIQFLGIRNDISELLQAFDALILPSLFEGMPGVAVEAQAAGLSCLLSDTITTEASIVKELVQFLPINKGAQIWASEILKLVQGGFQRKDMYQTLKENGYDVQDVAKWYESFYVEALLK